MGCIQLAIGQLLLWCIPIFAFTGGIEYEDNGSGFWLENSWGAVCDPLGITAQTVETITRASENKMRQTLARIEQLIGEYEIERIVLGYPKNMNNTVGERGEKTQEFKAALERRTGLEVILWDERLTTVAAERVLIESGVRRENRKKSVDQIAAAMILQGYLDSLQYS